MSLRFQRRIAISKVVVLILSKTGISISFGMRGLWLNLRRKTATWTFGIPGTGISYRMVVSSTKILQMVAVVLIGLIISAIYRK